MRWPPSAPEENALVQRRPYQSRSPVGSSANDEAAVHFKRLLTVLWRDGVPTARGKTRWYPATVKAVVTSDNAAALA